MTNTPKQLPAHIQLKVDEIMDNFDFEQVNKVMNFLNWTWWDTNGEPPDIPMLRATAREMLITAYWGAQKSKGDSYGESTGGFSVRYFRGKDEDGVLENFLLEFVLTDWRTEG